MAFSCDECGYKDNTIQSSGDIPEEGIKVTLKVNNPQDLRREVIKGEYATVSVPDLDLTIPPTARRGEMTTVEGLISKVLENLEADQILRRRLDPETAEKMDVFIERMRPLVAGEKPFTIILDDPSGNSIIQRKNEGKDPELQIVNYPRTFKQNQEIGIGVNKTQEDAQQPKAEKRSYARSILKGADADAFLKQAKVEMPNSEPSDGDAKDEIEDEVMFLPGQCEVCATMGKVKLCVTEIPYFKKIVIMAFTCDNCGYKSNEIHPGGGIPEKGLRIKLSVECPDDLDRSILKSESAALSVPELELDLAPGTLGGKFTTLEGILNEIRTQFADNPFLTGDSGDTTMRGKLDSFVEKITSCLERDEDKFTPFTVIVEDPLANSHIQNVYAPDPDPQLTSEEYKRDFEQDEELGLNDINVDNY